MQPTFRYGLLLQVPFALAAYLVARLLLRVAREIGRALHRRPRVRLVPQPVAVLQPYVDALLARIASASASPRGPPLVAA
jgi:hypothetical protein